MPAKTEKFSHYPMPLLVIGLLLGIVGAMSIVIPSLNPPDKDIRLLVSFMCSTGILTIALTYAMYRLGFVSWFRSLRWSLLVTIMLTVLLIFLNVWVTAQLMFISEHDLILTTGLLVFAGLVAISFGFFVSNVMTDGIRELAQATENLAKGDLNTRIDLHGNDELAQLANAFNMMAQSLQKIEEQKSLLEQARRDLIAWVSHDLRTPLASIRVMVEAMVDGVVSDTDTVNRYLRNMGIEIEHLSHLIDDLFELAQLDTGQIKLRWEMASLRDLISDTLGSMSAQAQERRINLMGMVDEQVDPVYMAPDKIQRVLYNLVHNAIVYSSPDEKITLSARIADDEVRVDVHNTGSNIAPTELPYIFDSFFRGERSRAKDNSTGHRGAGLGLAIARGFVEAHGGKIWVESDPTQGTTFSFVMPRFHRSMLRA